eukprot:TRINITY_DN10872_c0_g1_i1.p1 TRINITY_DN10872_c0_g1~~TRINITY_DN10872_c0_g1_i1.p1  ORF type:complete len:400 (+),score=50.21 TRINITY_DN10872_c0_g1_i1:79-1278(+)
MMSSSTEDRSNCIGSVISLAVFYSMPVATVQATTSTFVTEPVVLVAHKTTAHPKHWSFELVDDSTDDELAYAMQTTAAALTLDLATFNTVYRELQSFLWTSRRFGTGTRFLATPLLSSLLTDSQLENVCDVLRFCGFCHGLAQLVSVASKSATTADADQSSMAEGSDEELGDSPFSSARFHLVSQQLVAARRPVFPQMYNLGFPEFAGLFHLLANAKKGAGRSKLKMEFFMSCMQSDRTVLVSVVDSLLSAEDRERLLGADERKMLDADLRTPLERAHSVTARRMVRFLPVQWRECLVADALHDLTNLDSASSAAKFLARLLADGHLPARSWSDIHSFLIEKWQDISVQVMMRIPVALTLPAVSEMLTGAQSAYEYATEVIRHYQMLGVSAWSRMHSMI